MSGLDRIREVAARDKSLRFTNLMHHITEALLQTAYRALKHDSAAGVDEVTWHEYGDGLEGRIEDLHNRVQSGRYRAKPSKRIWIPKQDGRQRPIGIAALEDKIVQKAVVMVLNQIYERDFLGFSYGFRPERNQHNALDAVYVGIVRRKVSWVLDADIRNFFWHDSAHGNDEACKTPYSRSSNATSDPEMAQSRGVRGRRMVKDGSGYSARVSDFALVE